MHGGWAKGRQVNVPRGGDGDQGSGGTLVSRRVGDGGCDVLGKGDFKGGKDCKSMAVR